MPEGDQSTAFLGAPAVEPHQFQQQLADYKCFHPARSMTTLAQVEAEGFRLEGTVMNIHKDLTEPGPYHSRDASRLLFFREHAYEMLKSGHLRMNAVVTQHNGQYFWPPVFHTIMLPARRISECCDAVASIFFNFFDKGAQTQIHTSVVCLVAEKVRAAILSVGQENPYSTDVDNGAGPNQSYKVLPRLVGGMEFV
jgi:hypothetical protein